MIWDSTSSYVELKMHLFLTVSHVGGLFFMCSQQYFVSNDVYGHHGANIILRQTFNDASGWPSSVFASGWTTHQRRHTQACSKNTFSSLFGNVSLNFDMKQSSLVVPFGNTCSWPNQSDDWPSVQAWPLMKEWRLHRRMLDQIYQILDQGYRNLFTHKGSCLLSPSGPGDGALGGLVRILVSPSQLAES